MQARDGYACVDGPAFEIHHDAADGRHTGGVLVVVHTLAG